LSENYFQHADHFTRVLNEQENNRISKINSVSLEDKNKIIENNEEKKNSNPITEEKNDKKSNDKENSEKNSAVS